LRAEHLFVYGTLRRGSKNKFARMVADRAHFVGAARVPGRLYDFGQYPGAVRSDQSSDQPDQWLLGEVWRFEDAQLLPSLDDYEGSEFERALASAEMEDGRAIECWIYWYVGPATGRLIASGDWLKP
jgi:gamma-glutamylcyclotransferase (GGCT)/AIG2-like uncharacterized protein YtfP